MKKALFRFITAILVVIPISVSGQTIDVSANEGPTLLEAIRQAREMRRLDSLGHIDNITIHLKAGLYHINEPLVLRSEDSGLIIRGDDGATVSGGITLKGWKREGKLWKTRVPDFNGRPLEFRQLWVNGKKAIRARDVDDFEKMYRILRVDKQRREIWVPAKSTAAIIGSPHPEMILHEMWCVSVLRIKTIRTVGDSAAVSFHDPESRIQFEHPWPSPMVTTDGRNSAFYLTNAKSLLDSPGEWYLDTDTHMLYYMPRQGENMSTAEVIAPMMENLLIINGTADDPVSDIRLSNLTFSHTTWRRPSYEGHVPLQAGMYLTDAYKLRPQINRKNNHKLDNQGWIGRAAAAVDVSWGSGVNFDNCTFTHLGGSGLDFSIGDTDCRATDCLFTDIGMNGCVIGTFSPSAHETHKPYSPSDKRAICKNITIGNNMFDDITNDDWGCVAILGGNVANTLITHNEIREVSYTGISLGWGWNRDEVCMRDNRIHANLIHHYAKHMYDVAGIYTLGNQPGTLIDRNVVSDIYKPGYAHDPNHWFYLYTDEGSSNINVRDNWCPAEKFLQNANGPGNVWENNGPMVGDDVKREAGIKKNTQ